MASKRVSLKGKGADLFFGGYVPPEDQEDQDGGTPALSDQDVSPEPVLVPPLGGADDALAAAPLPSAPARPPRRRRTTEAVSGSRHEASDEDAGLPASRLASTVAHVEADTIEAIRRVVKEPGREVSFVRLSPEEKRQLGDLVYTYKRQGQKTTENEIGRIAINYLLLDYETNGENSVLARALARLRA